ncbi:putative pre-mrna-splicing factor atp-dependent rna helicase deah5 [Nicotiana attenuata]|uniref:Pre-mrna-splicing factor atp-dependent rna helicase deah5 n=1 Tax=Nicotiana attenuata TaxID=49451 RepID=A0A1J6IEY5_NICAT|nr:putative pre-mrna-splicing factor atp-dependent rna helicase deah5 [Nicotiana attenuata]
MRSCLLRLHYKPFRIYNSDFTHVFLSCHHQLMVNNPVRLSLKKCTARMDVNGLVFNKGSLQARDTTVPWLIPEPEGKEGP